MLTTMSTLIRRHTTRVFLISIAVGFAFLLVELMLIDHYRGTQLIAVIACVLGILLSMAGLVPRRDVRRVVIALFAVLALSGVYGFIEHLDERTHRASQVADVTPTPSDRLISEALGSFASNPPALAPLALTGFALFGALTLLSAEALPATQVVAKTRMQGALK